MFPKNRTQFLLFPMLCVAALLIVGQTPEYLGRLDSPCFKQRRHLSHHVLQTEAGWRRLTGSVIANYRETPISEGTVKDGKIHFVVGNPPRQRSYEGSVEGDR